MAVSKTVKTDKSNMVEIKPDQYIGLLCAVVHLGNQQNEYKGVVSVVDQVLLQFELQDVLTKDGGKPVVVSKVVRNSMKDLANLIKIAGALGANTAEGVDFEDLIGRPVLINMQHNEAKTKVVPKEFTSLPSMLKSQVKPLQTTPLLLLDVEEITDTQKQGFSEWIRNILDKRIKSVHESDGTGDTVEL